MPNLDLVGWIALTLLLIIALAWLPVLKVLVIDTYRLLHPPKPELAQADLQGLSDATQEIRAEREQSFITEERLRREAAVERNRERMAELAERRVG